MEANGVFCLVVVCNVAVMNIYVMIIFPLPSNKIYNIFLFHFVKVRWKGYGSDEDTWELIENLGYSLS